MIVLGMLVTVILIFIAGIHLFWFFDGAWGFEEVLPTHLNGKRVLNPKKIDSLSVGLFISFFALIYCVKSLNITISFLPDWILKYGLYIISSVFLVRAIGDFKYVGFFKKIKETTFGELDSKYFSPLCFVMGIVGILLEVIK